MVSDLIVLVLYIDSSATQKSAVHVYTTCSEHTHLSLANEKVDSLGQNCKDSDQSCNSYRLATVLRTILYTRALIHMCGGR